MNITENYPKYALSGHMEIHPCVWGRCPRVCQNLKNFFDQIVIIKECWDTNSKVLTIFVFLNFIHLPFFSNLHLAPNLYIVVQLVLHRDSWS